MLACLTPRLPRAPTVGSSHAILSCPSAVDANYAPDVSGEFVREDNKEDQEGLFLGVDTQVIDIATCEPVPDVYVEIWRMCLRIPRLNQLNDRILTMLLQTATRLVSTAALWRRATAWARMTRPTSTTLGSAVSRRPMRMASWPSRPSSRDTTPAAPPTSTSCCTPAPRRCPTARFIAPRLRTLARCTLTSRCATRSRNWSRIRPMSRASCRTPTTSS